MSNQTKSVFLYGKPTQNKKELFLNTQEEYTKLINNFIEIMANDSMYYLDILNNNKQSSVIRKLEKVSRHLHSLGSAYGQNAIDHAVKELHNHFIRIRNKVYGYIQNNHIEMIDYISYKSLLNASLCNLDELDILKSIIADEISKKKSNEKKMDEYETLFFKLDDISEKKRQEYKEYVADLFYEKLHYWKLPYIKRASLQVDGRVSRIEESHSTTKDFVAFVKLLGSKEYIQIPVSTSSNSLRRLKQYKQKLFENGKPVFFINMKNNQMKISIPFEKKVKTKTNKKNLLAIDLGITDLIHTNENKKYGTFSGMTTLYEELVEIKLGKRSSLRNVMKKNQKRLKKSTCPHEQEKIRKIIFNIASNLNNKKTLQKQRNKYNHQVDKRIHESVKSCFEVLKKNKYTLVYEDLDITEYDRGKKNNKRDSSWVRGKLIQKLIKLCDWNGINHISVDPAYTSKACPKCHNIDNDNRYQKSFVCTVCKHESDADYNTTINIKARAFDKELNDIVEKFKYSTLKRHQAIKELYNNRHQTWLETNTVAI